MFLQHNLFLHRYLREMLNVCIAVERATCRAKAGGRDDHEDDPATNPDNGPIAGCRVIEWWRPLDSGLVVRFTNNVVVILASGFRQRKLLRSAAPHALANSAGLVE